MSRRRLAIAAWLAGLALCAWQVAHTRFVADLSSFLPSDPTPEQRLLVDQLRDGAVSRIVLIAIEGADGPARARLSQALAAALRADGRFASVANGATGTFGTQFAPPGTGLVLFMSVNAGNPFGTRVLLISAAAPAKFPFRMCPSASSMSISALVMNGITPVAAEPASPALAHEWNRTKS